MSAGKLKDRFKFDKRTETSDGAGNTLGTWDEQFECWTRRKIMLGGETVIASRLQGVQPVALTVRANPQTRAITPDWRARDVATGLVYNIRAVAEGESRAYIEIMCEAGVAHG